MTMVAQTKPARPPIGAGPLHNALEQAREKSACEATGRLYVALAELYANGYQVSEPFLPRVQPKSTCATWLIDIVLPTGEAARLAVELPRAK